MIIKYSVIKLIIILVCPAFNSRITALICVAGVGDTGQYRLRYWTVSATIWDSIGYDTGQYRLRYWTVSASVGRQTTQWHNRLR